MVADDLLGSIFRRGPPETLAQRLAAQEQVCRWWWACLRGAMGEMLWAEAVQLLLATKQRINLPHRGMSRYTALPLAWERAGGLTRTWRLAQVAVLEGHLQAAPGRRKAAISHCAGALPCTMAAPLPHRPRAPPQHGSRAGGTAAHSERATLLRGRPLHLQHSWGSFSHQAPTLEADEPTNV